MTVTMTRLTCHLHHRNIFWKIRAVCHRPLFVAHRLCDDRCHIITSRSWRELPTRDRHHRRILSTKAKTHLLDTLWSSIQWNPVWSGSSPIWVSIRSKTIRSPPLTHPFVLLCLSRVRRQPRVQPAPRRMTVPLRFFIFKWRTIWVNASLSSTLHQQWSAAIVAVHRANRPVSFTMFRSPSNSTFSNCAYAIYRMKTNSFVIFTCSRLYKKKQLTMALLVNKTIGRVMCKTLFASLQWTMEIDSVKFNELCSSNVNWTGMFVPMKAKPWRRATETVYDFFNINCD